jgi:K+-transporting ATPase ATPase A chain
MTEHGLFQLVFFLAILIILVKPLGWYIAQVFQGEPCRLDGVLKPVENLIYRILRVNPNIEMNWKGYATSLLVLNLAGIFVIYLITRIQGVLPLNPQNFPGLLPDLAFNVAISFTTNTNWQAFSPETSLSYFTQMVALTTQNFISAATGLCVVMTLIRGFTRQKTLFLGNYWVDMVRSILYLLLPLAMIFAIILISQGVIQNLNSYQTIIPLQSNSASMIQPTMGTPPPQQLIPMGPTASQVAIKHLGTNGGGFFNTNSAHPFENPTPLTNFLQMLAMLLIPASLCYTFGIMVGDKRQGWTILIAMLLIFTPLAFATIAAESMENPSFNTLQIVQTPDSYGASYGNMEGKETRFGITNSSLFITASTATSTGAVNSMIDSFTPLGGLVPLWLIQLGEVVFGGVGTGLVGMLILVIMTVFIAGLMVGRTPEYLGKKIEPYEMKMASFGILIIPITILITTSIAVLIPMAKAAVANPGAHGFTEILYAFSSMSNNNGSSMAGLNANNLFYNTLGGIAMLIGRYGFIIPVLAIAGSLAQKKLVPVSPGTLPTHTPLFLGLLLGIILLIGALSFFPALALGPIAEYS